MDYWRLYNFRYWLLLLLVLKLCVQADRSFLTWLHLQIWVGKSILHDSWLVMRALLSFVTSLESIDLLLNLLRLNFGLHLDLL